MEELNELDSTCGVSDDEILYHRKNEKTSFHNDRSRKKMTVHAESIDFSPLKC